MRLPLRSAVGVVSGALIGVVLPLATAPLGHADTADQPDLVVSALPAAGPKPGERYDQAVTVTNRGTGTADDVTFQIRLTRGLDFTAREDGCVYTTLPTEVRQARCRLGTSLAPGASVAAPVRFTAQAKGLLEVVEYGTGTDGRPPRTEGYDDAYRRLAVTVDSTADLVAVGDRARAEPGDLVQVTASLRNEGPGWIHNQESDDQPALMVRVPAGTDAVEVPAECAPFGVDGPSGPSGPGHRTYVCWHSDNTVEVGQTLAYTFGLKVRSTAKPGTLSGKVTATSVYDIHPVFDANPANDTASLDVRVTGGAGTSAPTHAPTPTPGGSAGSGGAHGQSVGGRSAGGAGTSGLRPLSAGEGTVAETGEPVSGGLAGTGAGRTGLLAATAAGAGLLGGLLLLVVRRRGRAAGA